LLPDVKVFHSGTTRENLFTVTDGGRVLSVTALGDTLAAARDRAYQAVSRIQFTGAHYRKDIAAKALR
jgi:phosphoribosylamine--glycine ligase